MVAMHRRPPSSVLNLLETLCPSPALGERRAVRSGWPGGRPFAGQAPPRA